MLKMYRDDWWDKRDIALEKHKDGNDILPSHAGRGYTAAHLDGIVVFLYEYCISMERHVDLLERRISSLESS